MHLVHCATGNNILIRISAYISGTIAFIGAKLVIAYINFLHNYILKSQSWE